MNTTVHSDTPMGCDPKGGESDYGAPPPLCRRLSSWTAPSSPSTDNLFSDRDAGATTVGATVSAIRTRSKERRWWKSRKRPGGATLPKRTPVAGARPPDENADPGLGQLEISRDSVVAGSGNLHAQTESEAAQGTAASVDCEINPDARRLAAPAQPENRIKIVQINAARSKAAMHEIEQLLVRNGTDVCLIQEPATDGSGGLPSR